MTPTDKPYPPPEWKPRVCPVCGSELALGRGLTYGPLDSVECLIGCGIKRFDTWLGALACIMGAPGKEYDLYSPRRDTKPEVQHSTD